MRHEKKKMLLDMGRELSEKGISVDRYELENIYHLVDNFHRA